MTTYAHGPWFQHKQYVSNKESFAIEDNGMRIGETPDFIIDAENEVNACLIAAAPELLAILKKVQAFWNNDNPNDCCPYQEVDAIINKATGIS